MKKLLLKLALVVSALFVVSGAHAQTTYSMPPQTTFICQASGHYPVTSFYQFDCQDAWAQNPPVGYRHNGIPMVGADDVYNGSYFFWNRITDVFVGLPGVVVSGAVMTAPVPLIFTQPFTDSEGQFHPGTFSFTWEGNDSAGVAHSGSASATWTSKNFCGGKACWYHPVLLTFDVTVNN